MSTFEYKGRVWIDHWHDGDTFYGVIDPGYNATIGNPVTSLERIRMAGINAPELLWTSLDRAGGFCGTSDIGKPNPAGQDAWHYAQQIAPEKAFYQYIGRNRDKYGRPLMDIMIPVPASIALRGNMTFSAAMLGTGHAVVMKG